MAKNPKPDHLSDAENSLDELTPGSLAAAPLTMTADDVVEWELLVKRTMEGKRLDKYLVDRFPQYSRSVIQKAILTEGVRVNGRQVKCSYQVRRGDKILVCLPPLADDTPKPEDIPINIVYEDDFFLVVNKPPGMVVHPAKANWSGTLVNAIQFHLDRLSTIGGLHRPGIVHRLDRDTSGLLVVAKDDISHSRIAMQFENRTVRKEYLALTCGVPDRDSDFIEKPLGPHPTHREKMAIRSAEDGGKEAVTYYEVVERFDAYALVRVEPHTGRTHQIRVHLAHIGCPVLADYAYGGRRCLRLSDLDPTIPPERDEVLIERQSLHAFRLSLEHPRIRLPNRFEAPLPADMQKARDAIARLRPG